MAAIILVEIMRIQYSMQYSMTLQCTSTTVLLYTVATVYCILQLVIIFTLYCRTGYYGTRRVTRRLAYTQISVIRNSANKKQETVHRRHDATTPDLLVSYD